MADCIDRLKQIPKLFWLILLFVVSGQVLLTISLASPHWSVTRSSSTSSKVSEVKVGIWKSCYVLRSGLEICAGTGDLFKNIKWTLVMAVVIGFGPVLVSVGFVIKPGFGDRSMVRHLGAACFVVVGFNLIGFGVYFVGSNVDSTILRLMDNPFMEVRWALILNAVGCGLYLISVLALGAYYFFPTVCGESSGETHMLGDVIAGA